MNNVLQLTKDLINIPSITPEGAACIDYIIALLEPVGFSITRTSHGPATNLWARYGTQAPLLCFLGHVDVVPAGPIDEWFHNPFQAIEKNGYLYGRGASDMKGGVAAMIVAAINFIKENPDFSGSVALLLTSAEEAMEQFGVPTMVSLLQERGEKIDYCIVGEPSSSDRVGDLVRIGRRGSLNATLTILGKQGHVAHPHLADNPLHKMLTPLAELAAIQWDKGSEFFPPTCLQFSNINAGTGADNIIPGKAVIKFNVRFSPTVTVEQLQMRIQNILDHHQLNYRLAWSLSGLPFLTAEDLLIRTVTTAIQNIMTITPTLSAGGGTSDGRFIAPLGAQVVELGVSNATAHKINECVKISDLENLVQIYQEILSGLYHA